MATLAQIRTAVDTKLAQLWPGVQAKQDAYAAAHDGRYWQGLITASTIPADGTTVTPDVGNATPTDQPDPWPAALVNSPLPMAIQMDVYDGPLGAGYVATCYVRVLGNLYVRSQNVGPETWRTAPWTQITPRPPDAVQRL